MHGLNRPAGDDRGNARQPFNPNVTSGGIHLHLCRHRTENDTERMRFYKVSTFTCELCGIVAAACASNRRGKRLGLRRHKQK